MRLVKFCGWTIRLGYAREVLRRFGNMSSATIMFVLKSMLQAKSASGLGCGMAFGPGLAAESMIFELAAQTGHSSFSRIGSPWGSGGE
jgi:predicted naringenin-chalcone synthase